MNKAGLRALIAGIPSVEGEISPHATINKIVLDDGRLGRTAATAASAAKRAKRKAQKRARQITRRKR